MNLAIHPLCFDLPLIRIGKVSLSLPKRFSALITKLKVSVFRNKACPAAFIITTNSSDVASSENSETLTSIYFPWIVVPLNKSSRSVLNVWSKLGMCRKSWGFGWPEYWTVRIVWSPPPDVWSIRPLTFTTGMAANEKKRWSVAEESIHGRKHNSLAPTVLNTTQKSFYKNNIWSTEFLASAWGNSRTKRHSSLDYFQMPRNSPQWVILLNAVIINEENDYHSLSPTPSLSLSLLFRSFFILCSPITKNAPYGNFHACALTRFQNRNSWAGRRERLSPHVLTEPGKKISATSTVASCGWNYYWQRRLESCLSSSVGLQEWPLTGWATVPRVLDTVSVSTCLFVGERFFQNVYGRQIVLPTPFRLFAR